MKIFISSTYEDLKDHRRAVIDAILQLREQPIAMESFGAHPTEPKSAALTEIADCDALVGIYAYRYGWIPDGDTCSITEQEFNYARERGISCFCYRVQKDFAWDVKFVETGVQADRLQEFLAKIGKLVTWKEFTTLDDLAKKVVADLSRELHAGYSRFSTLHSIPPPPRDFTGRENEVTQLVQDFGAGATISGLTGMGGIGKTALALVVADKLAPQFLDAQIFVDMRGTARAGDHAELPLQSTDAMRQIIHDFAPTADLRQATEDEIAAHYRNVLHDKRALILLDNAADAAQVKPLIPPPTCALLITSRRRFALPGLRAIPLDVMPLTDARDLLVKIAPRVSEYAGEIAQLCGYLPLALRVAASTLAVRADLAPTRFIERLQQQRLEALKSDDDPEGDVEAVLGISYALLEPEMQARWRALSVFPASFNASAAASVWAIELGGAQDLLSDLVRLSLLNYATEDERPKTDADIRPPSSALARYSLHDLLRDYADARLNGEERNTARLRHAQHYLQVARTTDELYLQGGEKVLAGLQLFDTEFPNIRTGQEWATANILVNKMASELCNAYPDLAKNCLELRLNVRNRISWLNQAIRAARMLKDEQSESWHLGNRGVDYNDLGKPRQAIRDLEIALTIARKIHDYRNEGIWLGNLGNVYADLNKKQQAMLCYKQALRIARKVADQNSQVNWLACLGDISADLGKTRQAINYCNQAIFIARLIGSKRGEAQALGILGNVCDHQGDLHKAIYYYENAVTIAREIGDNRNESDHLYNLGLIYEKLNETKRALDLFQSALQIFKDIQSPYIKRVQKLAKNLNRKLIVEKQKKSRQKAEHLASKKHKK